MSHPLLGLVHKSPIRVLFIIQGYGSPSNRVRVLDLLPTLEKTGIHCTVTPYPHGIIEKIRWSLRLRNYDVVLLQKKLLSGFAATLFKLLSRKIVFDFDDATHLRHDAENAKSNKRISAKTVTSIQMADVVISGNRVLRQFAEKFNSNVSIIPSCVDVDKYPLKDYTKQQTDRIIIGWIGSTANLHHLILVSDVLRNLSRKYNIVLHVISGASVNIPGVVVHFIPWHLETQGNEIAKFDIGIMPLEHSNYSAGKCGYKALQCMAAGMPVVVSNVGGNADVISHGIDGLLANTLVEFEQHLGTLIRNPELRASIGSHAREKVRKLYSVEVGGNALAKILWALANSREQ